MKRHTRHKKLAIVLRDEALAAALVDAGLDTPRKIKAAADEDLDKAKGVGKAKRQKIRAKLPKVAKPKKAGK